MFNNLKKAIDRGAYNVIIDFDFFGGSLSITTDIDNVRCDDECIYVENALLDETEIDFEIKVDSTVKVTEKEFEDGFQVELNYKGITGIARGEKIYITVVEV